MSEGEKALGQVIAFINKHGRQQDKEEMVKPIGVIKTLVDKSIPKKAIDIKVNYRGYVYHALCPICYTPCLSFTHCGECGQALYVPHMKI